MARHSWNFDNTNDNGYMRIQAELLQNIRDTLDEINLKLGNLPTCDQLGYHLRRTVNALRAPKRKARK